jgi:TolB-like protein/class 3 adenylate cyclase/Tfp pilus assembly protein PilF
MEGVVSEDATGRVKRRLAAILFAGYRRLLPGDEAESFAGLALLRTEIIEPQVLKFGGHIIRWMSDEVLVEFESVVEAVRCAAALREAVSRFNQAQVPHRRVALRVGINLDDIIVADNDVFGDGVNIAARLEALAEPGSIYISEIVRDRVAGKVDFDFVDLGPKNLKNISESIRVYRMGTDVAMQSRARSPDVASPASSGWLDDRRAIAVLPFLNFSDDPEQEYFADGITEDIISMLAGWRAFPVIARDSTFTFKGKAVDIKKVGEQLGARYIVEGSVRKSGHRVRITAQLIRADTGHRIMAERFDRDLTDLFELQDEITRIMAGALEPELLKFERNRIANQPQRNQGAYELYQRGMFHHYRQNKADNIEAQAYFRRALVIDAQYPQATAALAIAVCNAGYLAWADDAGANYAESYDLAQHAVALDARYPNAHFALAVTCMYTHRPERATAEFEGAIRLNPSFAAAHAVLGHHLLNNGGRPEETIPLVEKAIGLSPADPRMYIWLPALASAHYQLRHYAKAVEIGRRAWALNRSWPAGLQYVVAALAQLGRMEEAAASLTDYKAIYPDLATWERIIPPLFRKKTMVDHIRDGLRKAGFE